MREPIKEHCPSCQGKGHIMDGLYIMATVLSVVLIPLAFFERNDRRGLTRKVCPSCGGTGERTTAI